MRKFVAQVRLAATMGMSWFSPLQFAFVAFLFLTANYGHFTFMPYWLFIVCGLSALGLFMVGIGLLSVGTVYKGEVDYFIEVLESRGYEIVKKPLSKAKYTDAWEGITHSD